ncbi:MAG: FAD-dependent oxidoreductase [Parvularculaceae bacterium]
MKRPLDITRRDFLNGVSIPIVAGLAPAALVGCGRAEAAPYPPALTGLRGAHAGSFETAHALAWEGKAWARPDAQTDGDYDLIVIGGGISGLASAYYWRQRVGADQKILILDNHDDFGGHAKRNEFDVDGKKIIGYGGSQSLDGPSDFSPAAKKLIAELGIEPKKFYDWYDQDFYASRGMGVGVYLDKAHYGEDRVIAQPFPMWGGELDREKATAAIDSLPWAEESRASLKAAVFDPPDYLTGMSVIEKADYLRQMSYEQFLINIAEGDDQVATFLRRSITGLWGVGWDALSALEAVRIGMPGTAGLGLEDAVSDPYDHGEPYIFHFPDGNASVARLLVRALRPDLLSGSTVEDLLPQRVKYDRLDHRHADVRIRLSSTAVNVANAGDGVDVVYVKDGEAHRVRGRNAVYAGYLHMLPFVTTEIGAEQRAAIDKLVKIPLVYANVAIRNWRAFEKAGFHRIYSPQGFFESIALDFPVSIGGYHFSESPDEPIVIHMQNAPTEPGLSEREQHKAGRAKLYQMTYDDFEKGIVEQLDGMLREHGFDAARDIAAITVNRWPHGYAYEYNELYDPWDWSHENGPHITARQKFGRVAVANSDSSAYAYVHGAIDAADRAVAELIGS